MSVFDRRVQEGCFVFQVLEAERLFLLSTPDLNEEPEHEEEDSFDKNELIAVDLIQPAPEKSVFVRLADQSGWVLAQSHGEVFLRQLPVTTSRLFTFYADCTQLVRRHPMDESSELLSNEEQDRNWHIEPMQKIYCDAMVEHPISGVKFYRIQGGSNQAPATSGWVHDKELVDGSSFDYLLLPCHKVTKGLFAYRALRNVAFREHPDCTDESKTAGTVLKGDLVVADILRESPVHNSGNGPFLRVTDGSGWLFANKLHEPVMEAVPIHRGKWILTVLNDPLGLKLQKQPKDCPDNIVEGVNFAFGTLVECDRKIENEEVTYYRVAGTTGWLFDSKQGHSMLSLLKSEEETTALETHSWDVNFVRGIAATVDRVHETNYDADLNVLSFSAHKASTVSVYCESRTIGTMVEREKRFEHNCSPQDLTRILSMGETQIMEYIKTLEVSHKIDIQEEEKFDDTSLDAIMGEPIAAKNANVDSSRVYNEEEEDLRKELLQIEADIFALHEKRWDIIEKVKEYDTLREKQVVAEKEKAELQQQRQLQFQLKKGVSPRSQRSSRHALYKVESNSILEPVSSTTTSGTFLTPALSQVAPSSVDSSISNSHLPGNSTMMSSSTESSSTVSSHEQSQSYAMNGSSTKSNKICGECGKVFSGKYSRDIHCREVHKLFCEHCDKIFTSFKELEKHMQEKNHW